MLNNIEKGQEVYIHKSGPMIAKHNLEKYVITSMCLDEEANGKFIIAEPVDNPNNPIIKFTRKVTLWGRTYPRFVEETNLSRPIIYRMINSRDDYLQELLDSSSYSNYLSMVSNSLSSLNYNELVEVEKLAKDMMSKNKESE